MASELDELIHAERGRLLSQLPKGASTFCSAGCAGKWYFDWVEDRYGPLETHYGVELFSPKPDDLPPNVRWIQNSVSKMVGVPTGAIDILFSGQNVEHLFFEDLEQFFREANRVIRRGGHFCLDSPNRLISQELGYTQPQHVLELSIQEAVDLVEASGFTIENVHGIWCCANGVRRYADVLEMAGDIDARRSAALLDPQSSFIWWLVARKTGEVTGELAPAVERIVTRGFPSFVSSRFRKACGTVYQMEGTEVTLRLTEADQGCAFFGPYVPLRAGSYQASFDYRFLSGGAPLNVDVVANGGTTLLARQEIAASSIGEWSSTNLNFSAAEYVEGVEARLFTSGADAIVRFGARIVRR